MGWLSGHWMGVWGRLRVGMDILEKRKMSYVSHGRNDRFVWRQARGLVTIRIDKKELLDIMWHEEKQKFSEMWRENEKQRVIVW